MPKQVKIYKPSREEIIRNVIGSFQIEQITVSYSAAKETLSKVLSSIRKAKR
jgi:hypothetical protein